MGTPPAPRRQDEIAVLFAPLGPAMAELAGCYDDQQLEAITSFLTGLEAVLDNQIEALPAPVPTKSVAG